MGKCSARQWMTSIGLCVCIAALPTILGATPPDSGTFNVRAFGAKGDGKVLDSPAINAAIDAAAAAGGGTVYLPAGTYLSFSIRLKSDITIYIGSGATILAADPADGQGRYDLPEPNEWDLYQDFGHSHWQNSLLWGIGLENVTIAGSGRIHGKGLTRRGPGTRRPGQPGDVPLTLGTERAAEVALAGGAQPGAPPPARLNMDGQGNKAIALKLCRNVTLRDFTIFQGGHFAILSTGLDNLTIDNLRIDTNRDGINIDSSRNVRITNATVNSPNDDAIVLKSSYGLGFARATENVVIANCRVSGYDLGTMLDGTLGRTQQFAPDRDGVTGRIKLGTESNGGFKNIVISNCIFEHCRGLALETVDGGNIEDVAISNLTMRDIVNSPIFIRLGRRARGPNDPPAGAIRRVKISNLIVSDADSRYATLLSGIPGHPIEDVDLSNIRIVYRGGGTQQDAALDPPEQEKAYPEPSMFGKLPAYGIFARHVKNLSVRDVEMSFLEADERPAIQLRDASGVSFERVKAPTAEGVATFVLRRVAGFEAFRCPGVPDRRDVSVDDESF